LPEKQPIQGGLNRIYQADFSKNKLEKIVAGGEGKSYPARQCKMCTAHKK